MKQFSIKPSVAALAAAFLLGASCSHAGPLQAQMDQVFNSMTNVTAPGVYETQRRGVLTAGSAYVRNKIVDTQIAAFAPPSWKAGCGGIDFFAGSFSFINADQFVQLLRSVASNAVGYAFQIALDNVCTPCSTYMNTLQDKIQKLNEYAGNSCQLAQGLVNDMADGIDFNRKNKEHNKASLLGMTEGFMDGFMETGGKDSAGQAAKDENTSKELYGNLVWKELQNNQVAKWFVTTLGSDRPVNEMLMSITGTVIVSKPKEATDSTGNAKGNASDLSFVEPKLHLTDLVEGGEVELWMCESDECMRPTASKETIDSLKDLIQTMLTGGNGSVGIINKYANPNDGYKFTDKEKALLAIIPDAAGALLRNLSLNSPGGAMQLAEKLSYAIAIQETYTLMNDLMNAVSAAIGSSKMGEAEKMVGRLDQARITMNAEFSALANKYPTMAEIIRDYHYLNMVVRKADVMYRTSETAKTN